MLPSVKMKAYDKIGNKKLYNTKFKEKWKEMLKKTEVRCPNCKKLIKKFKGFEGSCPYCRNNIKRGQ